ncbi:hypothetical protein K0M31_016416 [Melipona bicolor]|uniref:Uncharacterized protein n=1 Tax=Melipona bicolor TaxID=60889 RepID=A0AA40KTK7_9HYME|nr:hypothetical protein K0M31_016416 [Melipona bicolor]
MEKLPLIPGYTFQDPNVNDYKLLQKFHFLNGYRVLRDSHSGIGGRPVDLASSAYVKEETCV